MTKPVGWEDKLIKKVEELHDEVKRLKSNLTVKIETAAFRYVSAGLKSFVKRLVTLEEIVERREVGPENPNIGMNCFSKKDNGENILWCIPEGDAQTMAKNKYGRELTERELGIVSNSLGHGFEGWHVILSEAIEVAVEQTKEAENAKK